MSLVNVLEGIAITLAVMFFVLAGYAIYCTVRDSKIRRERFAELQRNKGVVQYEHHGYMTSVKQKYKGKHKEMCLCYDCKLFEPTGNNCHIAQELFKIDKSARVTTPVVECACFKIKE